MDDYKARREKSGEISPTNYLDLGRLASRAVRQYISVVEVAQFVVLCYSSPSKLIQRGTGYRHVK